MTNEDIEASIYDSLIFMNDKNNDKNKNNEKNNSKNDEDKYNCFFDICIYVFAFLVFLLIIISNVKKMI